MNASKGLNAHVLRTAGCTFIVVPQADRSGPGKEFTIPAVEPEEWVAHRAEGTIYERQKSTGATVLPASTWALQQLPGSRNTNRRHWTPKLGGSFEGMAGKSFENPLIAREVPAYWACLGCGQQRAWTLTGQTETLK